MQRVKLFRNSRIDRLEDDINRWIADEPVHVVNASVSEDANGITAILLFEPHPVRRSTVPAEIVGLDVGAWEDLEADEEPGERDPLFRQAAETCIQHQGGSTSLLQRRLRIGYGRAARIIDQLHYAGVLGPPDGSKPREVLIDFAQLDSIAGDA